MVFESVTAAGVGRLTSRFALVGKGDRGIPKVGPPNRQTAAFAVRHPLPGRTEWLDGSRWGLFEAGRFEAGWFEAVRSAALGLDININVNMNGSM